MENFQKQIEVQKLIEKAETDCAQLFKRVSDIALFNQRKVLNAFQKQGIAERHLNGSSGYGYGDIGRDALCRVYADVFNTEAALVSPLIANGTHALTIALFGLLRQGDALYSVSGAPYDTLRGVISGEGGSLREYGISYCETQLLNNGFDYNEINRTLTERKDIKVVFVTRSRGYSERNAFACKEIGELIAFVKRIRPVTVFVDNCYGEFCDTVEPTDFGADVIAGSLIKNIGGGLAPTGGYIAGKAKYVEQISYRLTAPGLGNEVGSYMYGYTQYYEGLFIAPSVVSNAIKGSILFASALSELGYKTIPSKEAAMNDIIRTIIFDTKEQLISFIQSIQRISPIDSNVVPEPWDMPGYTEQVIMAAGTFVCGASIELSADAPIKKPYAAYLQGGLTYEHVKLALESVLMNLI